MHRLILSLALAAWTSVVQTPPQVRAWEKVLVPGLTYRMEWQPAKPLAVHALRWSLGSEVRLKAVLAGGTVLDSQDQNKGRFSVSQMAESTKAIAGINGDFFPWTGDPIGLMISGKELISRPWPNRAIFAWNSNACRIGRATFKFKAAGPNGWTADINGLNEESGENMIVLNRPVAGYAQLKTDGVHCRISLTGRTMANTQVKAKVIKLEPGISRKLGPNESELTGSGTGAALLNKLKPGDELTLDLQVGGMDVTGIEEAVGGGPVIVRAGKASVEHKVEAINDKFATDRHPRSAIGRTASGDVWMVVVDGRQPTVSRGVSLAELAEIMIKFGCVEAMNLDGGGSSEVVAQGVTLNRPSDGTPRPIANGILAYAELSDQPTPDMVIQGRPKLTMGVFTQFRVVDSRGLEIPNGEVFWSSSGAAWVDQGGFMRPIKPGEAILKASVRGRILEVPVTVEGPTPPQTEPTSPPPNEPGH